MNDLNKKCKSCGEDLKPSQYARRKKESNKIIRENEDLVCRNYPICKKSEKEV